MHLWTARVLGCVSSIAERNHNTIAVTCGAEEPKASPAEFLGRIGKNLFAARFLLSKLMTDKYLSGKAPENQSCVRN